LAASEPGIKPGRLLASVALSDVSVSIFGSFALPPAAMLSVVE
jgi:hypothetical protein